MKRTLVALLSPAVLAMLACQAPTDAPPLPSAPAAPLVQASSIPWPITDLGTLPGGNFSFANDLNASSVVVGYAEYVSQRRHAMRWTITGGMQDLGALAPGEESSAEAINDAGDIVGVSGNGTGVDRAFVWTPAIGMVELPSAGAVPARAFDISNAHLIVGCGALVGSTVSQVLQWSPVASGGWSVAGVGSPLGSGGTACAHGIGGTNLVGWSQVGAVPTGFRRVGGLYTSLGLGTVAHRLVSNRYVGSGGIQPGVGGLPWAWPGLTASPFSLGYLYVPRGDAFDLNGANHIVGTVAGAPDPVVPSVTRAFYWDCASGMTDLGSLGGAPNDFAVATAINASDVVAGASNNHAVIWGVAPGPNGVVPLPYTARCTVPPVVGYLPRRFINDGILSRPGFDATLIDPNTVTISDGFGHVTPVAHRAKPPGPPVFVLRDINGDGVLDMQVQFSTTDMITNGTLTRQSFQFVVSWVDATGLPGSGKYPIRVQ
jgi:probable HAF family extracellular repeat protein